MVLPMAKINCKRLQNTEMGAITMKKYIYSLCFVLIVSILSGCSGGGKSAGDSSKPIELKMSVTTSETSVWMTGANEFKRLVEERTDGRYKVSIFPNEQLSNGDQPKGVEMLFTGVTDIDIHSTIIMSGFEPKLSVVSMPWIFPNGNTDVDAILFNGEGGKKIKELVEGKGAHVLGIGENGFRQLTNSKRPINTVEDMKQLKVRTPAMAMYIDFFKMIGADPTSMSWSEVFTALQQGTIDAQENPLDTIRSGKIQEVQKYLSLWNYSYDPLILSVSDKVWKGLSDEDKEIFRQCGEEAMKHEVEKNRAMNDEILASFKDSIEISEPTGEQIETFRKACEPLYQQYKDVIGEDVFGAFGYSFK
jgi:tripartite ATP-independent transporter DctP family solute receptor